MANKSWNLTRQNLDGHEMEPDKIGTGTNGPGTGDIEVRVNLSNVTNYKQLIRAMMAFIRRFEDGRFGSDMNEV